MANEIEWTPEELRIFAETREGSYTLWSRLQQEHPDWPYQKLATEFFNQAKSLPYTDPKARRKYNRW